MPYSTNPRILLRGVERDPLVADAHVTYNAIERLKTECRKTKNETELAEKNLQGIISIL